MTNKCEVCKIEFETTKPAKTCSPKCRVTLSRFGVTKDSNVTLAEPSVTHEETFKFYTIQKAREPLQGIAKESDVVTPTRKAQYWYDVPLGAIPIIQKDWPEVPIFDTKDGEQPMNGRQYFLWWKNEFKVQSDGSPIIHNPFPAYDNVRVEFGGEGARRWGA